MMGERPMGEAPMADFVWPSLIQPAYLRMEVVATLDLAADDPVGAALASGRLNFAVTLKPHYLSDRVPA